MIKWFKNEKGYGYIEYRNDKVIIYIKKDYK